MEVIERTWDEFLEGFRWNQGEHMTLIGPTGQGKTTLARILLDKRRYLLVIATKRRDPLIREMKTDGDFQVVRSFAEGGNTKIAHKYILDVPHSGGMRATKDRQAKEIQAAIEAAYDQGGWCVYIDEGQYVCNELRLDEEIKTIHHTGRTLDLTLVMGVQRPVNIPLIAYSGATHIFFWRNTDEADLKRIGGIGGISNKLIRETVSVLESHQVLYLNTRSGEMVKTKAKVG